MCLAVPVRVTENLGDDMARVRVGEGETYMEVSTLLLEKAPEIGDYLIVHAGFGLRVLDPVEAEESLKIFRQMAELGPETRI